MDAIAARWCRNAHFRGAWTVERDKANSALLPVPLRYTIAVHLPALVCALVFAVVSVPTKSAAPTKAEAQQQLEAASVEVSVEGLIQYAAEGDVATVELLLAAGVSAKSADPMRRVTPLHNAAAQGHVRLVNRFVELGADVDAQDWAGSTPLVNAAYHGREEVVEILLTRGSRTEVVPAQGPTALIAAIQSGSLSIVDRLLRAGADPTLSSVAGQSPLSAAELSGRTEIASRLSSANAGVPAE